MSRLTCEQGPSHWRLVWECGLALQDNPPACEQTLRAFIGHGFGLLVVHDKGAIRANIVASELADVSIRV